MWFFKKKKKKAIRPPSYAVGNSHGQPAEIDNMAAQALDPLNPLSPFWIGNPAAPDSAAQDDKADVSPPTAEAESSSSWSHDSGSTYSDSGCSSCDSGSSDGGGGGSD